MMKKYVNTVELAEMVSVSVQTIYNNTYKIAGRVRIGGRVRYCLAEVEKALQKGKLF